MLKNTYKITVNTVKKTVLIAVGELASQEAAQRFIAEYQLKTKVLNASEYILDIDCKTMKVVTQELAGSLEGAFRMYKESGFSKVVFHIQSDVILKMQFSRIARLAGLENIEIIQEGA